MKSKDALRMLAEVTAYQWGMVTSAQASMHGITRLDLSRLAADGVADMRGSADELMRGMGLADIESRVRALGGTAVCGPYEDGWRVFVSVPKKRWTMESRD